MSEHRITELQAQLHAANESVAQSNKASTELTDG